VTPPPRARDIPRVWEVDWAIPEEDGTSWESYDWALVTAQELGVAEITVVGATYPNLGNLNLAIGAAEADSLHRSPHEYKVGGVTVRGVTSRGNWHVRGSGNGMPYGLMPANSSASWVSMWAQGWRSTALWAALTPWGISGLWLWKWACDAPALAVGRSPTLTGLGIGERLL
jgi:hypothetical protein